MALLRHVENFTVVARAVEEILAPGDAVDDLQRVAAHIVLDVSNKLLDDPDDLMTENSGTWVWSASLIRMDVRTADRRHRHLHQNFAAVNGAQGELLHNERCVRCFVNG